MASDAVVNVFSCVSGKVVTSLIGHAHDVLSVSFSPDSSLIVTSSMDSSVRVWNSASGALIRNYEQHTNWVRAAGFSYNGQLVVSGSDGKAIHIFEVETGRTTRVLEPHLQRVMEVMFTADGMHIISLDDSDRVYIWDVATGASVYEVSIDDDTWMCSVNFASDGGGVLIVEGGRTVHTLSPWKPGTRTWPEYTVSKEGWLYVKSPGRTVRLGWLPPEWRNVFALGSGMLCAPDTSRRKLVVFDVSES